MRLFFAYAREDFQLVRQMADRLPVTSTGLTLKAL